MWGGVGLHTCGKYCVSRAFVHSAVVENQEQTGLGVLVDVVPVELLHDHLQEAFEHLWLVLPLVQEHCCIFGTVDEIAHLKKGGVLSKREKKGEFHLIFTPRKGQTPPIFPSLYASLSKGEKKGGVDIEKKGWNAYPDITLFEKRKQASFCFFFFQSVLFALQRCLQSF